MTETLGDIIARARYAAAWDRKRAAERGETADAAAAVPGAHQTPDGFWNAGFERGEQHSRLDSARTLDSIANALEALIGVTEASALARELHDGLTAGRVKTS